MIPIFYRKRTIEKVNGKSISTFSIHVKGFTDDTGREKAEIVISAMTGSHSRMTGKESRILCEMLNTAWQKFYMGIRPKSARKIDLLDEDTLDELGILR